MSSLILRNTFNNGNTPFYADYCGDFSWRDSLIKSFDQDIHRPEVKETDNDYQIVLAAPGITKEDFNIEVKDGKITIAYDVGEKENTYAYASQYSKSYTLPALCNTKKISASYENGILTVSIPKGEEAKPQLIKIN